MPHSQHISDLNEQSFADAIGSGGTVLVDFWAEWCQPCLALAPTLEEVAREHADEVTVAKVNIDANERLAAAYGIASIPTVLVFSGGEVRERIVGLNAKNVYTNAIASAA